MKSICSDLICKTMIILGSLLICSARSAENIDDFFAMSPAELAQIPISIATGTPNTVSTSPAVASVITAEQIKSMGATQLHEVLETVPGMHASLQASTNDYTYSMRGIKNATNSQILFLLDGTRITTPFRGSLVTAVEIPVEAIQQIELIRGPGSAVYGADAFAGVVNIITKKAKDINGGTIAGRAGDHGTQSGWGQYSKNFSGWALATSLQYQHSDGDNGRLISGDNQSRYDSVFGTHASHAPGPMNTQFNVLNGHINLQRKYLDLRFWAYNSIDSGARSGTANALNPSGRADGMQYLGDIRLSTEDWFKDWELNLHLSYLYANFKAKLQAFPDGSKLPIGPDGNIQGITSNAPLVDFPNGANVHLGRIENIPAIQLSSEYRGITAHKFRSGFEFRREQIVTNSQTNFGPGVIDGSEPKVEGDLTDVTNTQNIYLVNRHRNIWSTFLQDEWRFAKNWELTMGIRYDHYSDFGSTFNPRAALVWNVNKEFTHKLMYGKAFRAPNFTELGSQNNPAFRGNKDLNPETIHTLEWAMDFHPSPVFRTALNLYFYEIERLISVIPNLGFRNSGHQDGYGSELEWNWQINNQVNLTGNYAWQYAVNEQTERRIEGVPEHHFYIAAAWQFLPQWQFQSQLNVIAGRISAPEDKRPLDDYQTLDFTVRGKKIFEHINILASLRNALDTTYREPAAIGFAENLPMPGRSFYLEAAINF